MDRSSTEPKLFILPHEVLVEHILVDLNRRDTISCLLVCRHLRDIISCSALLSYFGELEDQGLVNNASVSFTETPLHDRLEMLSQRERSWHSLSPRKRIFVDLPVPEENGIVFDIARAQEDGIYIRVRNKLQSDFNARALKYFTWQHGVGQWKEIAFTGHHLVDFALAVSEYDVIACLTCTGSTYDHGELTFRIQFFHHSTSLPFGDTELLNPVLSLPTHMSPNFDECRTGMAIYGKHLAVRIDQKMMVFNWKTGAFVGQMMMIWDAQPMFFLSEDLICVPLLDSEKGHALLVYQIVLVNAGSEQSQLTQGVRLDLPEVQNPDIYYRISVFGTHPQLIPPKASASAPPFLTNPDSALLIIDVVFYDEYRAIVRPIFTSLIISFSSLLLYVKERITDNDSNQPLRGVPWKEWSLGRVRLLPHERYRNPPEISAGNRYLQCAPCHGMLYALDRGEGTIEILDFGHSSIWGRTASQSPSLSSDDEDWVSEREDCENEGEGPNGDDEGTDYEPSRQDSASPTESSFGPDTFEDLEETYTPDGPRPFTEPITTTLPFVSRTFQEVYQLEEWTFFVISQTSIVGYMDLSDRSQTLAGRLEILYFG